MKHRNWSQFYCVLIAAILVGLVGVADTSTMRAVENLTPLDEYVAAPDDNYQWELRHTHEGDGWKGHVIHLVSQSWLTPDIVDRNLWEHWLVVMVPDEPVSTTSLMFITGGSNRDDNMPRGADANPRRAMHATNTVVAQLHQVPNQPLYFAEEDGRRRGEDSLIAYNWVKFMHTGDPLWLTRLPMTKSVVRAMDTVQAFCASDAGGGHVVEHFVVAGASKRGWTTWTTAAVDNRVIACAPIVIDCLNVVPSFIHHWEVNGFWAPAVGDYVRMGIMNWLTSPEFDALLAIVDPYSYLDRLTMPKLIINGTGDQFFLHDSWQFYWDDLKGPKYLRYAPNAGHGMDNADAPGTVIAFYKSIVDAAPLPEYAWSFPDETTIRVISDTEPLAVKLWQATNPEKREFRINVFGANWTETVLEPDADGAYVGRVPTPEQGYTAYLVELTFAGPGEDPLVLSTPTRVTPDVTTHRFEPKTEWPEGFLSGQQAE